jgi:methionine sulfoxide reductase heme-binding subunit
VKAMRRANILTEANLAREFPAAAIKCGNGGTWSSFLDDLRAATLDAALATILSGIAFAILILRLRAGTDYAALEMPGMVRNGGVWSYSLSQAVGWAALSWSWLTILLGVSLPVWTRQRSARLRVSIERLHRSTSLTVVGLMVAHAVLLSWDKMGDTLITEFVPWTTPYLPGRFPQTLGILSFYLAALLGLSFYFRKTMGPQTWRFLHRYFIPAVYILAVWHTFTYGSDVRTGNSLWISLWVLQIPILLAFAIRLPFWSGIKAQRYG